MKCPSCGTNIENGARFCGVCGRNLAPPAASGSGAGPLGHGGSPGQAAAAPGKPAPMKFAPPPHLAAKQPADPYIGKLLNNRFKVEAKLGEGGFGAVYRGTQVGINRKVALKLLH